VLDIIALRNVVPDPDALAAEFMSRGLTLSKPLQDTHDGLRALNYFRPPSLTPNTDGSTLSLLALLLHLA
jgi:hypothetical protein